MDQFDVAVVGAGPAGSAAAYQLAKSGLSVILIERGGAAGQKNVFGGRIYAYPLQQLIPDWQKDCPIERIVTHEGLALLTADSMTSILIDLPQPANPAALSFTALRPAFDKWLATKAEAAGAMLITGIRVDDLRWENGRVAGIVAGTDQVKADVTIAADGVVSGLAQKAKLRPELPPGEIAVGVKETIQLPQATLEERFGLTATEGVAISSIGYPTQGLRGGGFLYTNKTTVSLGLVVDEVRDLTDAKLQIADLMDQFRLHPHIQRYLKGGKVIEYSAHMIPKQGWNMLPPLWRDGFLVAGDAGGFLINHGYSYRGVDLAIASGMAAASAVLAAKRAGDFSANALGQYRAELERLGLWDELKRFRRAPRFLRTSRLFSLYPQLACDIARAVYGIEGMGHPRLSKLVRRQLKGRVSYLTLLRDLIRGARSM